MHSNNCTWTLENLDLQVNQKTHGLKKREHILNKGHLAIILSCYWDCISKSGTVCVFAPQIYSSAASSDFCFLSFVQRNKKKSMLFSPLPRLQNVIVCHHHESNSSLHGHDLSIYVELQGTWIFIWST